MLQKRQKHNGHSGQFYAPGTYSIQLVHCATVTLDTKNLNCLTTHVLCTNMPMWPHVCWPDQVQSKVKKCWTQGSHQKWQLCLGYIARHYRHTNHGSVASLRFIGIEKMLPNHRGENRIKQLLRREAYWINELSTFEPLGMKQVFFLILLTLIGNFAMYSMLLACMQTTDVWSWQPY